MRAGPSVVPATGCRRWPTARGSGRRSEANDRVCTAFPLIRGVCSSRIRENQPRPFSELRHQYPFLSASFYKLPAESTGRVPPPLRGTPLANNRGFHEEWRVPVKVLDIVFTRATKPLFRQ